jgi:hypothetical protein
MQKPRPLTEPERQYLLRWKRLGPILDAIRHRELRRMTEKQYFQAVEQLWSLNLTTKPRPSSGLVEWQKLLRR